VEQHAKVFGQLLDTQALHAKVHSATGKRLKEAESNVRALQGTSDMHTQLHQACGAGLLNIRETVGLHGHLHKDCVHAMVDLKKDVGALNEQHELHEDLHKAIGNNVVDLKDKVGVLCEKNDLHAKLHKCTVGKFEGEMRNVDAKVSELCTLSNELLRRSDLHTKLHKESDKFMEEKLRDASLVVAGDASGMDLGEIRKLQAAVDTLALENAELKKSVDKHTELHKKTASVVASLGIANINKNTDATAVLPVGACSCTDCTKCTNCMAQRAHAGVQEVRHAHKHAGQGSDAVRTKHSQLLTELEANIASTNKPLSKNLGKKHR
jgi:hypothetical protein